MILVRIVAEPDEIDVVEANHSKKTVLTPREREVLTWIGRGKTALEIARILNIAKRTVDEHAQTALRKLGAANRAHAVAIAIRDRLVDV